MTTSKRPAPTTSTPSSLRLTLAAMFALAVAMGFGRFAFTPMFPLMLRAGRLSLDAGAVLASSNYLGYWLGAMSAHRIKLSAERLLTLGLASIVLVTVGMAATTSLEVWIVLRFLAGVLSAWALIATSAWGLGWLAAKGCPQLAGVLFSGVGLGIAAVGIYCMLAAQPRITVEMLWAGLALLAALAALLPVVVSRRHPAPDMRHATMARPKTQAHAPVATRGLVLSYGLLGFGYILPATYLPTLARQLVDNPQVFGWAWPLFGLAAALSTVIVARWIHNGNRLHAWALAHLVMALGVLLPIIWFSLTSIVLAALLVGGTFMVITMLAMQEARIRAELNATQVLAQMTAGFAVGQLMGPVVSALLSRCVANHATALSCALTLAASGLIVSAIYLWRLARQTQYAINH